MHHKASRTQIDNVHSVRNLVALCSICHLAFDREEWTFLPKDMATWVQDAKAEPRRDSILKYNAQQNIECQRWRLQNDPDSKASQDRYYVSAFTDRPIKIWQGEPGVLVLRNTAILETPLTLGVDMELEKALDTYDELRKIWMRFNTPCLKDQCRICSYEGDNDEARGDEGDEGDEKGEGDDGDERGEGIREDGGEGGDEGDERDEGDEGGQPSSKTRKTTTNRSRRDTTHSHSNTLITQNATRKENETKRRKKPTQNETKTKKKSALYDKSVPYSHREGYTFANCTANDLMEMWQAYRK
jgi:hypothetical protein